MQMLNLLTQLGVATDFISLAKYWQALSPFMGMKASEISPMIVGSILHTLGIKADASQVDQVTKCLQTSDLDTLADMLSNEHVATGMVKLLQPSASQPSSPEQLGEEVEASPFVEDCRSCHTPISVHVGYCTFCR